jgi:hypothetical protein
MLQLIIQSIPVRVFWKDKESRYLGCNRLFVQDAGLKEPHQLIGRDDFAMGTVVPVVLSTGDPSLSLTIFSTQPGIWLD